LALLKNSPNTLKTDADASMGKENEQSPSLYPAAVGDPASAADPVNYFLFSV
jgi:hypothetical protein